MRLSETEQAAIRTAAIESFGQDAEIWLFGSRVDDSKKGGDIDLLIKPASISPGQWFARKIQFLGRLERELGERKIDVILEAPNDSRPIVRVARAKGIQL